MQSFPTDNFPCTYVLRHRRENLKKCSLRGLEKREDFQFLTYPNDEIPLLNNYILLVLDAPELSREESNRGLFLLDGTWRYAEKMYQYVLPQQPFLLRSLPRGWRTAYPRRQADCPFPEQGLASIEALYASYYILGRDTTGLLEYYHWKNEFLDKNTLNF